VLFRSKRTTDTFLPEKQSFSVPDQGNVTDTGLHYHAVAQGDFNGDGLTDLFMILTNTGVYTGTSTTKYSGYPWNPAVPVYGDGFAQYSYLSKGG